MRRWGKVIDFDSYSPGSFLRLIAMVIAIFLIPLQLFCDGFVRLKEEGMIIKLQANFPETCQTKGTLCSVMMSIPHLLFEVNFVVFSLYGLLLIGDSWLAYKTTLVTCFGIFFISFLQMAFKSGRPFWDKVNIHSNGHCYFDFSGPSNSSFMMTFYWPYVIIMFLFKYYKSPNKCLNWTLLFLLVLCWAELYLDCLVNGLDYIYQLVIGQMTGFCYLVAVLVFDEEVHRYCQKTGFLMRQSRSRKFYLFFFILGAFVF